MEKVVIEVTGVGSEIVVGTIDETAYEFWFENKDGSEETPSLKDYCLRKHDEDDINEEHDFLENDWSENDDIYHDMGASYTESKICITVDGQEILNDYFLNLKNEFENIKIYYFPKNLGYIQSVNCILSNATGEKIIFVSI